MGKIIKTFYEAYRVEVHCTPSKWYRFYIDIDRNPKEFEDFIQKAFKSLNRKKLMRIIVSNHICEVEKLSTKEEIFKCIKDNNFD